MRKTDCLTGSTRPVLQVLRGGGSSQAEGTILDPDRQVRLAAPATHSMCCCTTPPPPTCFRKIISCFSPHISRYTKGVGGQSTPFSGFWKSGRDSPQMASFGSVNWVYGFWLKSIWKPFLQERAGGCLRYFCLPADSREWLHKHFFSWKPMTGFPKGAAASWGEGEGERGNWLQQSRGPLVVR